MDFSDDHFALLGMQKCFAIDPSMLETNYRSAQGRVHPDRFAHAGDAERRRSLQWSSHINEAYQTLRKPLSRAIYLLGLHGVEVGAESNTAMPPEFLVEQMEWREALDDAKAVRDQRELDRLHAALREQIDRAYADLHELLDTRADYAAGAACARKLMFLERLDEQIGDALADFD